jgi:hypothetical protein
MRFESPPPWVIPEPLSEVAPVAMSPLVRALAWVERMHAERADSTLNIWQSDSVNCWVEAPESLRAELLWFFVWSANAALERASAIAAEMQSALFM